jgi:hypothetical protein
LEAYTVGDGKVRTRPNGSSEHTIVTASHRLAGDLQELALKVGWVSSMTWVPASDSTIHERGKSPRVIRGQGGYSIHFKKGLHRAELLPEHVRRVAYDGMIYCLNVPYHTLYVRRNGRPSWNGNTPSTVWLQVLPGPRVRFLRELCSKRMGADGHSDDLLAFRPIAFPGFEAKDFDGYADPAGWAESQTDQKTCADIFAAKGIRLQRGAVDFAARFEAMAHIFRLMYDGRGAVQIDPRCRTLRKAFLGGYHYRRKNVPGKEMYKDVPEKNHPYSDVANAAEYPISRLFNVPGVTRQEIARQEESARSRWREARGFRGPTGQKRRSWVTK